MTSNKGSDIWDIFLPIIFGGLFAIPGMLLILTGIGRANLFPELTDGPRWIFIVLGLPFFSWGVWIASGSIRKMFGEDSVISQLFRHFLVLGNLIPMAGIFTWSGFGPGEREFIVTTTTGPASNTRPGNELVGRCVFGGIGLVMVLITIFYIRYHFFVKPKDRPIHPDQLPEN